ncbi:Acetyltransferase [uncultured Leptolyngbya sp.]|uniref:Acetyltransferase n=1 Tax=uncultured Leptolyngbya sp. TaxID=332963 RepID=A0A6J4MU63_9CYAN|nr:Acetyltransferase [uncultured Leptolyngbya sp.]
MYQVRLAILTDLDLLQGIERAASVLFPAGRLPDSDDVMPMSELEAANRDRLLLVSLRDEGVIGFAMSKEYDGLLHLAVMAVHPDHGKRGVGSKLVQGVIERAKRRQLQGVTLTTFRDLPWNAPFYGKLGFRTLSDSELSFMLRETLGKEESLGMTERVAMLYSIAA